MTVLFRLFLSLPHFIYAFFWALFVLPVVFVMWLAALLIGRAPRLLHGFVARFVRHSVHATAYFHLVANPFPPFFGEEGTYPIDLKVAPAVRQNRLKTLFRLLLGVPALVMTYALLEVLGVLAFMSWFIALVMGRIPDGIRDAMAFCLKYEAQTAAYMTLLTDRYPSFDSPRKAAERAAAADAEQPKVRCANCQFELATGDDSVVRCPSCGAHAAVA